MKVEADQFIGLAYQHLGCDIPVTLSPGSASECGLLTAEDIAEILVEGPKQQFLRAAAVDYDRSLVLASMTVPAEFCEDHFPGYPFLPMAKLGQIMAQVGSILVLSEDNGHSDKHGKMLAITASVESIRSRTAKIDGKRKPFIVPGDNILLVAEYIGDKLNVKSTLVRVYVSGQLINEMESTYSVFPWKLFCNLYQRQPS